MGKLDYLISSIVHTNIYSFYTNVAKKYKNTYSSELMLTNIDDAYDAIYQIENGLLRRNPIISRWKGYYMASYAVEGQTRWNFAYRIEGDTIYVEDACHSQNMSEFTSSIPTTQQQFRKLTTKPLYGYSFVMNDKKEYNLIDNNGRLITQWFKAIKPFQKPYGKYQIIAYINVRGEFCALGYDGSVYGLNKLWQEMYAENKNILDSKLFMNIITEYIDNTMNTNKKVIRLTESDLHLLIEEAVKTVLKEKKIDRDYRDNDGNQISGKKALAQGGEYLKKRGDSYLNGLANKAVYNQAQHLYTVLVNFLKTMRSQSEMWRNNNLIKLAEDFKDELRHQLYAMHYGSDLSYNSDYYV